MSNQQQLKVLVRGAYDLQKLRIQMGNRIVANFKGKLGQKPSESEDEIDDEGKELLALIRATFKKMTEGAVTHLRKAKFIENEVISTFTEFCLVEEYIAIETQEKHHFSRLAAVLDEFPIYTSFLANVKGCGPAMSGVIISEIDIHKAQYPSSVWMYAGLDVVHSDGRGRSRRKEHLVTRTYLDKDKKEAERVGITFNPFLKTKLVGVLGSSFIKCDSSYRKVYDDYKHRLETAPQHVEKSKGHRHNMAIRYMVKIFLVDLYSAWRKLEGLPVAVTYAEAKFKPHRQAA